MKVSNQQHHRRQSKNRADGFRTWRPGNKQHRNNKRTNLYPTNNGNAPTPKKYNKKQLDNDAENFFRLIKLQAHFKDINPKSNTEQENLPFQIENRQKRTPRFSRKGPKQIKK